MRQFAGNSESRLLWGNLPGSSVQAVLWGNLTGTVNSACYGGIYWEALFEQLYDVIHRAQ